MTNVGGRFRERVKGKAIVRGDLHGISDGINLQIGYSVAYLRSQAGNHAVRHAI